jgi:hypothetical protein
MRMFLAVVLFVLSAVGARSEGSATPPIGFEALLGFDALPLLVEWSASQSSSYSRENKNQDAGNFIRVEPDGEQVLMDTDGPGVVYRLWSTGVIGTQMSERCRLRFWFDGETQPRLDLSIAELFGGKGSRWPFVPPLSVTFESGVGEGEGPCNLSYVPIPFAKHLKITGRNIMFYHVDHHRLPADTPVRSFSLAEAENHRASLERAAAQWNAIPVRPGVTNGEVNRWGEFVLAPGKSREMSFKGSGTILDLEFKLAQASPSTLRGLVLEVAFEDRKHVCVRVPVGDFFGTGAGEHLFKSLCCGMTERGYYAYWPMPFRKLATVRLSNETQEPARVEFLRVLRSRGMPDAHAGYFHARYAEEPDVSMREDYHILNVEGRGKLVGCNVTMQNARKAQGIFFLEGDEKIYVDGEKWPSQWLGTGTEDYFNGAYFWNHSNKAAMARPLGGLTFLDWGIGRVCAYRWHFPDYVSFTRNLKLDLEHGGESDWPAHYASVAYYYLSQPAAQDPLPSLAERLPRTTLAPAPNFLCCHLNGAVSLAGSALTKKTYHELESEFESDDGAFVGRGRPGDKLEAQVEVPGEDDFRPVLVLCGGPEFANVRASIDGKVLGEVSANRTSFTPWFDAEFKPVRIARGTHKLGLEIVASEGGAALNRERRLLSVGLVAAQLHPQSAFIDKWSIIGNWPCPKEGGWEKAWPAETNQDLTASYTVDGREVRWHEVNGGTVGLGGGDWRVGYGLTYIWSPDDREIPLFIGKDDGLKIWVNDKSVFDVNTWSHAIPDQFHTTMSLRSGWNKVLVKCANWNGGWAFMLRPADPDRKLRFARTPD